MEKRTSRSWDPNEATGESKTQHHDVPAVLHLGCLVRYVGDVAGQFVAPRTSPGNRLAGRQERPRWARLWLRSLSALSPTNCLRRSEFSPCYILWARLCSTSRRGSRPSLRSMFFCCSLGQERSIGVTIARAGESSNCGSFRVEVFRIIWKYFGAAKLCRIVAVRER